MKILNTNKKFYITIVEAICWNRNKIFDVGACHLTWRI